jgi:hypothetical protein
MKNEIDRDFYCSAGCSLNDKRCRIFSIDCDDGHCQQRHRKHPTPEQFKEEYGEEWTGAVYLKWKSQQDWTVGYYDALDTVHERPSAPIICACTPFGKPPDDWGQKND